MALAPQQSAELCLQHVRAVVSRSSVSQPLVSALLYFVSPTSSSSSSLPFDRSVALLLLPLRVAALPRAAIFELVAVGATNNTDKFVYSRRDQVTELAESDETLFVLQQFRSEREARENSTPPKVIGTLL
jgi:hypothetical protein